MTEEIFKFKLNADGVSFCLTGCGGYSRTHIEIPREYQNKPVTEIASEVCEQFDMLDSVSFPDTVVKIGENAFLECEELKEVHITDLNKWLNITFETDTANPLYFAHNLFLCGEKIENLVIPDGAAEIKEYAFVGCDGLKTVTIPDSVTKIGAEAFTGCYGLKAVHISDLNKWLNITFGSLEANPLYCAGSLYINGKKATEITISGTDNKINYAAFADCLSLKKVKIEKGVKLIEACAFQCCRNLESLELPDGLTEIEPYAFWLCESLTEIKIPETVVTIGSDAFHSCKKLAEVTVPDGVRMIGVGAFQYCERLKKVRLGEGITELKSCVFYGCTALTEIEIGNNVAKIADSVFRSCKELTEIKIPDKVTEIGFEAFLNCGKLNNLVLPKNLTIIKNKAFKDCVGLKSVTVPKSLEKAGADAFENCDGLEAVFIADMKSWCKIDFETNTANPLYHAQKLYLDGELVTELNLPDGITEINDRSLWNYNELTKVTASKDNPAFLSCGGILYNKDYTEFILIPKNIRGAVAVHKGITEIGIFNFRNRKGLTEITLPDGVTEIKLCAFACCSSLKRITIPESVTIIASQALYGCKNLTEIIFTGSEKAWEKVKKYDNWDEDTGEYTVFCSDGTVKNKNSVF